MTRETRRAEKFDAAIKRLDWCAQVPHTVDNVVGIYAEKTRTTQRPLRHGMTNDEILSSITQHSGGGGKGGHADLTAQAALYGEPDAIDDDGTLAEIRGTIEGIAAHALELDDLCAMSVDEPKWRPPATDPTLTGQVRDAVSRLHHACPLLDRTAQVHPHADWLLHEIAESAGWLHDKTRGIWDQYRGDQLPVAEQKPIEPCRLCGTWRNGTIAVSRGRCEQCTTFQGHHNCTPTERIVTYWEAHGRTGRNVSTPPGMILEAKAASRRKVG